MFHKVSDHSVGKLLGHVKTTEREALDSIDVHVLRENKQG